MAASDETQQIDTAGAERSTLHLCVERCFRVEQDSPSPLAVWLGPGAMSEEGLALRRAVTPEGWRQEDGSGAWESWTPPVGERNLLLIAPFVRIGDLNRSPGTAPAAGMRRNQTLPAAALLSALAAGSPGQRFAAVMPATAFASQDSAERDRLLNHGDLVLFAEGDPTWAGSLGFHTMMRLALVCVERREHDEPAGPARFISLPRAGDLTETERELRALFKQQGGKTNNGYVLRDPVDSDRPLQVASHDPRRLERTNHLRALGEVRRLMELAELRRGSPTAPDQAETADGVPVMSGRDVAQGTDRESMVKRPHSRQRTRDELKVGDLCVAAVMSGSDARPLRVRTVNAEDLPMVAGPHVLVVRPNAEFGAGTLSFLADYLASPRAAMLLRHESTGGPVLTPKQLGQLPVPMPDQSLLSALADLRATETQLRSWALDAAAAKAAVLGEHAQDAGLLELHSIGQLLRQRVTAAQQLDDLSYRVRRLFPFPVALPWQRAQTGTRDLEGYQGILECAESLTGYLAVLSMILARAVGADLGAVEALRRKLTDSPHGASMSDWTAIVREVAGAKFVAGVLPTSPFVELTELMVEGNQASSALRVLTEARNDLAHNRGPKGARVVAAFDDAMEQLEQLYEACQWLTDYPVQLIEETSWDSYSESGSYRYRELAGDHYLVPQREASTTVPTLNRGSLYVVDRAGELHLMSPLLLWHECEDCHLPSAFFLDAFDDRTRACRLRAMDHNHAMTRFDVADPLATWGLLPVSEAAKGSA